MDTQHIKKSAVRKYAKILQVDNPTTSPRLNTFSGFSVSPTSTEYLEKLSAGALKTPDNFLPYPHRNNSYQASAKGSPTLRLDSSVYATSQKILTTNSDHCFTIPSMDDRNTRLLDSPGPKSLKSVTARDGLDYLRHTQSEFKSTGYLMTSPNLKPSKIKSVSSMKGQGLDDLYRDAKDFSQELNAILSNHHEKTLKAYMKQLNIKEFAVLQKSRIRNVIRLVEKGFIPKEIKESNLMNDIWNVACTELNKVRAFYEDFLLMMEETLEKVAKGTKKVNDQMQPWEALKLLIEHSYLSREGDNQDQRNSVDPMQAIYNFKLDYKAGKGYNPKIMSIYELIEVHMRELNQLIQMEREKSRLVLHQKEQLQKEHNELENKQTQLKAEMMNLLHNRHKEGHRKEDSLAATFEERHLRRHIDDLQTENLKLFDEASQLRKELKETKNELKKMIAKEERSMRKTQDKSVMVDLFNNLPQGTQINTSKPKGGLTAYIIDPQTCVNGTEISKDLLLSLTNLMLSDKMITDVCDDFERRPRKPLNTYLTEWFLKRFGLYDFCEIIMRDYVFTLHNTEGGERYRILKELLGTTTGDFQTVFRFSLDRPSQIDRKKLRKATFSTAEAAKQFQKIINCIKGYCGQSSTSIFPSHLYGPYLPGLDVAQNLLSFDVAKNVLILVTKEANFAPEEIKDAEEYLKLRIQEQDLESKIIEDENPDRPELPANCINLDVFVRFLLEAISEKQIRGIERYYATLKTHVVAQKQANISFDEYVACVDKLNPEASQAWRDHSFAMMMGSQPANNVPLFVMMQNFVESYFNIDKARDSDNAKVKTETELRETDRTTGRGAKPKKPTFTKFGVNHLSPNLTQGTRPNSSRQRIFAGYRDGLSLGNNVLNEVGYEMYDCVSSLIVLQETYNLVEETIKDAEKVNDTLALAHETFKKELETFPKQMVDAQKDLQKTELLLAYNKEDLVDGLEHLWVRLRSLLLYTFRQK